KDKQLKLGKILQNLQTLRLALLRMKLRGKYIAASDRRAERMTIFGFDRHDPAVLRHDVIRMHKVKECPVRDSFQHRCSNLDRPSVPSHMRDLQRWRQIKADDLAPNDAQALELSPLISDVE